MTVDIRDLSLSFGDKKVLDSFSLSLPEKGIVCLYGPSGCGKTTLLNCIANTVKQDSGEVLSGSKRISFLFQEDRLLPWFSVLENVECVLPAKERHAAVGFLDAVGLGDEAQRPVSVLSGGMKRRAAIARCLAFKGDMYLLDEPFKGLSGKIKSDIMDIFRQIGKKSLVLMITHDLDEALSLGDKIYLLSGPPLTIKGDFSPGRDSKEEIAAAAAAL